MNKNYEAVPIDEVDESKLDYKKNYHAIFMGNTVYESACTVQWDKEYGFYGDGIDCDDITHILIEKK